MLERVSERMPFGELQVGGQQNEQVAQRAGQRRVALGEAVLATADDQFAPPAVAHQRVDHRLKVAPRQSGTSFRELENLRKDNVGLGIRNVRSCEPKPGIPQLKSIGHRASYLQNLST